jgi:hypothetical protein
LQLQTRLAAMRTGFLVDLKMNITDIETNQLSITDIPGIINRQKELLEGYKTFDPAVRDFDIESKEGQKQFKHLLWRILEELSEFKMAAEVEHQNEELIDSLHFSLELLLIMGYGESEIETAFESGIMLNDSKQIELIDVMCDFGFAGNFLKNKDWKRTDMETDLSELKKWLLMCFQYHVNFIWRSMGELIYEIYDRKSLVNLFRIRSNY